MMPLAIQDLKAAKNWYNKISPTLSYRFKSTINQEIDSLATSFKNYQIVHKNIHRLVMRSFPFNIFYTLDHDKALIVVIAILHHKRNLKTLIKRSI